MLVAKLMDHSVNPVCLKVFLNLKPWFADIFQRFGIGYPLFIGSGFDGNIAESADDAEESSGDMELDSSGEGSDVADAAKDKILAKISSLFDSAPGNPDVSNSAPGTPDVQGCQMVIARF